MRGDRLAEHEHVARAEAGEAVAEEVARRAAEASRAMAAHVKATRVILILVP